MAGNQRLGGVIWQGLFITKSRPFREVAKLMDSWTLSVFVSSCFGRQERKHDRRDYASNQVKAPSGYWHEIISCLLFVAAPSSNTLTGRYLVWGSQAGWFDRLYRTFLGVVIRFRVSSEHRAAKWLAAAMLRTFLFSFSFSSFFSMSVIPHPSVQSVRRSLFFFFFLSQTMSGSDAARTPKLVSFTACAKLKARGPWPMTTSIWCYLHRRNLQSGLVSPLQWDFGGFFLGGGG